MATVVQLEKESKPINFLNHDKNKRLKVDLHTHILPKYWSDLAKKYGYPGVCKNGEKKKKERKK